MAILPEPTTCRLDLWLWHARFFKTRALAAKVCDAGHIRLMRHQHEAQGPIRVQKAAQIVRVGDQLIFSIGTRLHHICVTGFAEQRGPATEAAGLYNRLNESN